MVVCPAVNLSEYLNIWNIWIFEFCSSKARGGCQNTSVRRSTACGVWPSKLGSLLLTYNFVRKILHSWFQWTSESMELCKWDIITGEAVVSLFYSGQNIVIIWCTKPLTKGFFYLQLMKNQKQNCTQVSCNLYSMIIGFTRQITFYVHSVMAVPSIHFTVSPLT